MSPTPPRVRFAPAPTGWLHIGGARTALFNWIYARQTGGQMLLRIEDTDVDRSRPELIDAILTSLEWLGIDWDGEPILQSDRLDRYREATTSLLDRGLAYRCDCTQDDVKARVEANKSRQGYDGHCRDRDVPPGEGVVVRFRTPDEGETSFTDVIRGEVVFENANLEDFVVVRSSGVPMFLVANAVDDAEMGITHVIRGEDLINVTPKVLLLRQALGVEEQPVFAHLPLIVNESRKKLSKRRDDVAVGDYVTKGFLPEAMANYLATLGWGPPDGVEIRPMAEIVDLFRLEDVNKASAFFDLKKLEHFNAEYLRSLPLDDFIERAQPFLDLPSWPAGAFSVFEELAPLVQERVKVLAEVPDMVDWVFLDEPAIDPMAWEKVMVLGKHAAEIVDDALVAYTDCPWEAQVLHDVTDNIGQAYGLKLGKTQAPVRVAVTGRTIGPPLFESLQVLGRDETVKRLQAARARL